MESNNKGDDILREAMVTPMIKILKNAGISIDSIDRDKIHKEGIGINVVTGAYCHMMDMGIIDPTKVTKEALKNAVSVATTLLSTETVITNIRA
jgi:chaperonin GroEL